MSWEMSLLSLNRSLLQNLASSWVRLLGHPVVDTSMDVRFRFSPFHDNAEKCTLVKEELLHHKKLIMI